MAADVLLRLAVITGDRALERRAAAALRSVRGIMAQFPAAAGHWLGALDFYLSRPKEIALIGDPAHAATQALAAEIHRHCLPNRILLGADADVPGDSALPLLAAKTLLDGNPAAYVCENYACQLPTADPATLARQLAD